jgi:3-hydroxy acid dehydrogenase/malonic semialdehyde reductase
MPGEYQPKVVFVTGASVGFGAATVRRFAKDGARVVATSRRKEKIEALRSECGDLVLPVELDVRDRAAVEAVVAKLPPEYAEIDVLVNNAGLALGVDRAFDANVQDWETMIDTNVKGLIYCTRVILPGMVARNRGHVVNLGSVTAEYPYPGSNVYGATKAFVHQFGLGLRADLVGTAIRVTDVAPALSRGTEFSEVRFHGDQAKLDALYKGTSPLEAEDVAEAIHWVATRPPHVNINFVQMMPVCQAPGPPTVYRS